jgi:hypothetical protein
MASVTRAPTTLDDLARFEGKAELIAERIVPLEPTGRKPNRVALRIVRGFDDLAEATGLGEVYIDNMGSGVVTLTSARQSFAPDASYFVGAFPGDEMRFIEGEPTFAVEAQSENDYRESTTNNTSDTESPRFHRAGRSSWWSCRRSGSEALLAHRLTSPSTRLRKGGVFETS